MFARGKAVSNKMEVRDGKSWNWDDVCIYTFKRSKWQYKIMPVRLLDIVWLHGPEWMHAYVCTFSINL